MIPMWNKHYPPFFSLVENNGSFVCKISQFVEYDGLENLSFFLKRF